MKQQLKVEITLVIMAVPEPILSESKIIVEQRLDSLESILIILEIGEKSSVSINGEREFGVPWQMLFMVAPT